MPNKVDQLIQRAHRSWYIDGIPDLSLGMLLWSGFGMNLLISIIAHKLTEFSQLSRGLLLLVVASGMILMMAGMMQLLAYFIIELKERLTYPRIGYTSPPRNPIRWQHWLFRFLCFEMCAALLILSDIISTKLLQWFLPLFGMFLTSMHLEIGYIRNLHRYYLLATFSILLVTGLMLSRVETVVKFRFYSSLMGTAELISGSITLWVFLNRNPLARSKKQLL